MNGVNSSDRYETQKRMALNMFMGTNGPPLILDNGVTVSNTDEGLNSSGR